MKKRIALLLVAVMLFSLPVTSLAAETTKDINVPKAGITPDSWLYGLDNFMKELHILVTFNVADKAGLLDDISGERLAEALKMVEEDKGEYALTSMKAYKSALEDMVEVLDKAILDEKDIASVLDKINHNRLGREELIEIILDNMSEEVRSKIEDSLSTAKDELEVTIVVTDLEDDEDLQDDEGLKDNDNMDSEHLDDKNEELGEESDAEAEDVSEKDVESTEEYVDEDGEIEEDADSEDRETELPLKKVVTAKILEETIGADTAQKFVLGEMNLRQILAVSSLAEQTEKSFDEILTIFLENGKGIGATAKALELHPKDALKEIKKVFKGAKSQIKADFAEAKQVVKAGLVDEGLEENLEEDQTVAGVDTKKDEIVETTGVDTEDETIEDLEEDEQIPENKENSSDRDEEDDDDKDYDNDDDEDDKERHKVKKNKEKDNKKNNEKNNGKKNEKNSEKNNGKSNGKGNDKTNGKNNSSDNRSERAKERSNKN